MLLISLAFAISVLSGLLAYNEKPQDLIWLHYDQTQQFSQLPSTDDIVIIEIDDKSISELGHWPWPRNIHANLLKKLSLAKTDTVIFDVLFAETNPFNPAADDEFSDAIRLSENVVLPLHFEALGPQGIVAESPPHQKFYDAAAAVGHIHIERNADGISRSVYLKQGINTAYWPHMSLSALSLSGGKGSDIPGARAPDDDHRSSMISIARDYYNLLPMPSADQGLRHISYSDVILNRVDFTVFQNKTIFVGATATGLGDVLVTPVGSMHGVELNAWLYNALGHELLIQPVDQKVVGTLTFVFVLVAVLILGRLSPMWFLMLSISSIIVVALASSFTLLSYRYWIPAMPAAIGITMFFPLWSWLRAESMLRYLRGELDSLDCVSTPVETSVAKSAALNFLVKLNLIEPDNLVPTRAGEKAFEVLMPNAAPDENPVTFWRERIGEQGLPLDSLQKAHGVELITRTISRLSLARMQDQRARQLIEESLSGLQDAVCIADVSGTITYTNDLFRSWFALDRVILDTSLIELLDELRLKSERNWSQTLKDLFINGEHSPEECTWRANSLFEGKELLCQLSLAKTVSAYKDTLILVFTDITSLKAAEKARSEALSFLSHDLRSPMVSVLAILTQVNNDPSALSSADLGNIDTLVRKNLDYAESFLQLSKAESFPVANLHPCDLHAVLDSAQTHALALATPKNIKVRADRCDEDAWVMGEHSLLERIAYNLVSNAIKFSPAHTEVTIMLSKNADEIAISVLDQGPGIHQELKQTLFKPFARGERRNAEHGAGLGLSFVAAAVSRFNGSIDVESKLGEGAKFTIVFPALSEEMIDEYFSNSDFN